MRHPSIVLGLLCVAVLTACSPGGSTSGPGTIHFTPGASDSSGDPTPFIPPTPKVLVTAPAVASDRAVTLSPATYLDPASPCAGQRTTVLVPRALPACTDAWAPFQPKYIAGADLVATSPIPRQARIAQDVALDRGTSLATAYYTMEMLRQFAETNNDVPLLKAVDSPPYTRFDHVLSYMLVKTQRVTAVPACMLPTSIRVVQSTSSVANFLIQEGWPQPSATAIVVNYAACPGVTFTASDGTKYTTFGQSTPAAEVFTGSTIPLAPFGDIFVVDGAGICGEPELTSVCGV